MTEEVADPLFREAVGAIDAGDVAALERLLAVHPRLVRDRIDGGGEGYFRDPYLLWFVAENPVRNGTLPANIAEVTRTILRAAKSESPETFQEQIDYALGLVCSGRVPRESGVQGPLIDVLADSGARPDGALLPALAHREIAAVERLLSRGAALTLPAAVGTGRTTDVARLGRTASAEDRQIALAAAALYGDAAALGDLIALGVDLNAYSPAGFHPHATALHHAVDSGSLDAVKTLVESGADLAAKDRLYQGTPLDWADSPPPHGDRRVPSRTERCLEVALLEHGPVMRDVAAGDVGQRPDGEGVPARGTASHPRLLRQIPEEAQGGPADPFEVLHVIGPRNPVGIGRGGRDVLVEAR